MDQQRQVSMDDMLKLLGEKDLQLSIARSDNMKLIAELGRVKKELEELKTGGKDGNKDSKRKGSSKNRESSK